MSDEHDEEHSHDPLTFQATEVEEETLTALRALHPSLADVLLLTRRFEGLTDEEKEALAAAQQAVEAHPVWTPGFHAEGDMCVVCETPTEPVFVDRYQQGTLPHGAFVDGLPVHAREECIKGVDAKAPRRSPQVVDRLRRQYTLDTARPSPRLTQFFRADVLSQPPFQLMDWANSVSEANEGKLGRQAARDIERLLSWVHQRLFH